MNYRHSYHAGNIGDVLKHIVLIALLQHLNQKEKPYCYLETHAGAGFYSLISSEAEKNPEYKRGISKLFEANHKKRIENDLIQTYLKLIKSQGFPESYPGSPKIAENFLRSQDSMILFELHAKEASLLKNLFSNNTTKIYIYEDNGFQGLKAQLPPKEGRGLILIDPSFELKQEWALIEMGLKNALARFAHGIYALWYPIKEMALPSNFVNNILEQKIIQKPMLNLELSLYPEEGFGLGMRGAGMLIINPPWELDSTLRSTLPILWEILSETGQGASKISFIEPQ